MTLGCVDVTLLGQSTGRTPVKLLDHTAPDHTATIRHDIVLVLEYLKRRFLKGGASDLSCIIIIARVQNVPVRVHQGISTNALLKYY